MLLRTKNPGMQCFYRRYVHLLHTQMATRAVKAKVEPQEVVRYEEYDKRHGAKYTAAGVADMDEDDGWGV